MITFKIFKTTVILALMSFTSLPSQGQDLLARQAPVDRKMKAVDSIVLHRLIEQETFENPSGDLYEEWDNQLTHYNASVLPDEATIDLRGFCMPTPAASSPPISEHVGDVSIKVSILRYTSATPSVLHSVVRCVL